MTRAERIEASARRSTIALAAILEGEPRKSVLPRIQDIQTSLLEALALPPDPVPTCTWIQDGEYGDTWATQCGKIWTFIEGSPSENSTKFCHNCGRPCVESFHEEVPNGPA